MITNRKKSIKLKNRTTHFRPEKDRIYVQFSSQNTYQSRQMKIESYETRLYWEYKYCEDYNGQTFFYTLTYNDAHLPKKYGRNCFDYEDLRDLLTGGFRKKLLRNYGTRFKYFVGAELGDGKGSRGMCNNPHYHILFFLTDAQDPRYPYKKISCGDFRHLVKTYWQGFDETQTGYRDYNEAKYGIAKEGQNGGKVNSYRACCYCAKYVCKDVKLKEAEEDVIRKIRFESIRKHKNEENSYRQFFHTKVYDLFNTPLNAKKTKWLYTDKELVKILDPNASIEVFYELVGFKLTESDFFDVVPYVPAILSKYHLWNEYFNYINTFVDEDIRLGLNEWRNRYSNKCRISHAVGDYALSSIEDKCNPRISFPAKKGFKNRPIGLYYYRKLFTQIVEDDKGNKIRILNEDGVRYKLNLLSRSLKNLTNEIEARIHFLEDETLFEKMRESDINTNVWFHHKDYKRELSRLLEDDSIQNIIKKYAEFKLVYENRVFPIKMVESCDIITYPDISPISDYKYFITPDSQYFYNALMLPAFIDSDCEGFISFSLHPYFSRYHSIFAVFDLLSDYLFVQKDDKSQREAEETAATRRFHSQLALQSFYANYQN